MKETSTILKNGRRTKYDMLDTALREKLNRGVWAPGDKIPSESELMEQYGVSRTLVRSVLTGLIHEELIESVHGKGSFVLAKKIHAHAPYQTKIREQLEQMGYITRIETLGFEEIQASPKLAKMLRIETGDPVFHYRHRRFVDGQPFSISESSLPKKLFPDLNVKSLQEVPLSEILEQKYGYRLFSANEFLEAIFASSAVAKQLDVTKNYPLLKFEQLSYTKSGIPYELNQILFRGDRVRLHFDYNR